MDLLLSCISTKHSSLKQHWTQSSEQAQGTQCPLTVLGSYEKPKEDPGGVLCFVDEKGCSQKTIELSMAAGMVPSSGQGVFVTSFGSIHEVDTLAGTVQQNVVSLPFFNALHSLSRTQRGFLVASTGLDLLLEFSRAGEVLWSWWATDHGFTMTPAGQQRVIDKSADHRTIRYGTLTQTTHVNSAAELPDGRILASLFHQGMVIAIDRDSGDWQPVLEGLDHPHAVRILDERHFTVADTVRGRALLVEINEKGGQIKEEIDAGTNWLQDCRYDYDRNTWILVDGKNARVVLRHGGTGKKEITEFNFDPEWRLYEAHVL